MAHYVIISPLQEPVTYLLFGITWISCVISALIAFYFYRTKREAWWLVLGLAVVLPLVFEWTMCLSHGLPPLPYKLQYPPEPMPATAYPYFPIDNKDHLKSEGTIENSVERVQWSFYPPLMATALIWAYCSDRKKRSATSVGT